MYKFFKKILKSIFNEKNIKWISVFLLIVFVLVVVNLDILFKNKEGLEGNNDETSNVVENTENTNIDDVKIEDTTSNLDNNEKVMGVEESDTTVNDIVTTSCPDHCRKDCPDNNINCLKSNPLCYKCEVPLHQIVKHVDEAKQPITINISQLVDQNEKKMSNSNGATGLPVTPQITGIFSDTPTTYDNTINGDSELLKDDDDMNISDSEILNNQSTLVTSEEKKEEIFGN